VKTVDRACVRPEERDIVLAQEPTTALPLRWGTYRGRYAAGLVLILLGGLLLVLTNTYFLVALLIGSALHVAGWLLLPAAGWRRIVAGGPSVVAMCALLAGPTMMPMFVLPLLCWLVVRHRPAVAAVAALPPLGSGLLLGQLLHGYPDQGLAVTVSVVVLVASAWAARALALDPAAARFRRKSRRVPSRVH
jgi:hypothetical protein